MIRQESRVAGACYLVCSPTAGLWLWKDKKSLDKLSRASFLGKQACKQACMHAADPSHLLLVVFTSTADLVLIRYVMFRFSLA